MSEFKNYILTLNSLKFNQSCTTTGIIYKFNRKFNFQKDYRSIYIL